MFYILVCLHCLLTWAATSFACEDNSVLHPEIKVVTINEDSKGLLHYDEWQPSSKEFNQLVSMQFQPRAVPNKTDYVDLGINLTFAGQPSADRQRQSLRPAVVAEVVIICDKSFGNIFNQSLVRILDYLTVYFWDVNMRFKTLSSVDMSIRITGVILVNSAREQPFIEEARASDRRPDFNRILPLFAKWVYSKMSSLPKFDMAVAITNENVEWRGGLANLRTACSVDHHNQRFRGVTVWNDDGSWASLRVGAHEMAHALGTTRDSTKISNIEEFLKTYFRLGAPHDGDVENCTESDRIMSGARNNLGWFFSTCSDRTISEYARSDQGACLRQIDQPVNLPLSADFHSPQTPSMEEQCKRAANNSQAFVKENETGDCNKITCRWVANGMNWTRNITPVDNSPCFGGNRCFRGRCRKPEVLIRNVGSGLCMKADNPFAKMAGIQVVNCPRPGNPLDRFSIYDYEGGKQMATPYSTGAGIENEDKCIFAKDQESVLWTDKCSNNFGLITDKLTKRCAKQNGDWVFSVGSCNRTDPSFRWRLEQV